VSPKVTSYQRQGNKETQTAKMGNGQSMEDHLFNLKWTAKQLAKESKKCESNAAANKLKCKKAMETGNMEGARIFAETAIRDKNQSLNYLRLSSRIDAVSQRVNTAVKMKTLTKDMSGIVNSMDSVMKSMNVEKITAVMDKFEKQFEDLDLATGVMEQSMQSSTAMTMPEQQVEGLMQQVADEYNIEFQSGLTGVPNNQLIVQQQQQQHRGIEEKKENIIGIGGSVGGPGSSNKKKPGDDQSSSNGSIGGGGGGGAASSAASSSAAEEESLEERLRRLQGGM